MNLFRDLERLNVVKPTVILSPDATEYRLPCNTYEASDVVELQTWKDNNTVYMWTVLMTVCFHLLYLIYHKTRKKPDEEGPALSVDRQG